MDTPGPGPSPNPALPASRSSLLYESPIPNPIDSSTPINNGSLLGGDPDREDEMRKLKREICKKSLLLEEKTSEVEILESKLADTSGTLSCKDTDILSLKTELKRVQAYSKQLERKLSEEKELRAQYEANSISNDAMIQMKLQYTRKKNELKADLEKHKSLVGKKDSEICDLEAKVKRLEEELDRVNNELNKARNSNGEYQMKVSESFRGTITSMESQLVQKMQDYESRIQEMNQKHKEELVELQNALKRVEEEQSGAIKAKLVEIEELKGRLEESRTSREETLEEMKSFRKKSDAVVRVLEKSIEELTEKNVRLESFNGTNKCVMEQMKQMEKKHEEAIKNLEENCKSLTEKNESLEKEIKELNGVLKGLENIKETNDKNLAVLKEYQLELKEMKQSKKQTEDTLTQELKTKDLVIEDKDRKIFSLQSSVDVLKKACEILEMQLNECERINADQSEQIDKCNQINLSLSTELRSLKEDLRRSSAEYNEAKSLRVFADTKIQELKSSLDDERTSREKEINKLKEQIELMTERNNQLADQADSLSTQLECEEEEKLYLNNVLLEVRSECDGLKSDLNKIFGQMVALKESNMDLEADLEDARKRSDEYSERISSLTSGLTQLEADKLVESQKFHKLLNDNLKLIEYLQTQVETLTTQAQMASKKKKRKSSFRWFTTGSGRNGNSERDDCTNSKDTNKENVQGENCSSNGDDLGQGK